MHQTGKTGGASTATSAPETTAGQAYAGDDGSGKEDRPDGQTRSVPHPFFYWCLLSGGLAIATAIDLDTSSPPAVALDSPWLYRVEVGGVVFLILYALGLLLGFAFFGRALRQLDLP